MNNDIDTSTLHHLINEKSRLDKSNTIDSLKSMKKMIENDPKIENNSKSDNSLLLKKEDSINEEIAVKEKSSQKTLNKSKNSLNFNQEIKDIKATDVNPQLKQDKSSISDKDIKTENNPQINNEITEKSKISEKDKFSNSSLSHEKSLKSMPDLDQIEYKKENSNNPSKSKKEADPDDEYSHIRIVRSYEDKDLRQNIDQFDIEYMCRCLGLALMKHIESSKEKSHILDLINTKEKFDFFNTIFNLNIEFFNTFFNLESKISNLEKLDKYFKVNEGETLDVKFFQDDEKEKKKKVPDKEISYLSHMKYSNEKNEDLLSEKSKIIGDLSKIERIEIVEEIIDEKIEIDSDMKTINDYFLSEQTRSAAALNNKYKNVAEKTKNILIQDLSSIKEVDSVDYVNKHLLQTVENKKINVKKPTTEYIDLLQDSATHFFTENDPVKLEELNKVFFI